MPLLHGWTMLPMSLRATLAGAVAGTVNALIYVALYDYGARHIVPAGAVHGAVLALAAVVAARWSIGRSVVARLLAATCAGWVGGHASWLPIEASVSGGLSVVEWTSVETSWHALRTFGLVALIFSTWLAFAKRRRRAWLHVAAAVVAGIVGYGAFWLELAGLQDGFAIALAHGSTWGALVGIATAGAWPPQASRELVAQSTAPSPQPGGP